MAVSEPLLATVLMLDVISGEDQVREEFALATSGIIPKVSQNQPLRCSFVHSNAFKQFTTESWYLRRGYTPLKTVLNYYEAVDRNGKSWDMNTIFMKKDI